MRAGNSRPSAGSDGVPELEEADRALQRATRMEVVWNIVWWGRVVYYLTPFFSLFLVALPWLTGWLASREFLLRHTSTWPLSTSSRY